MVCTANDLQEWKDFPKGLKVLLLEGDNISATEIRAKLEAMDYDVSAFCDENEALSAISSRSESFHIAIVEVSSSSSQGGFKFLENAKDLPTIMTSNTHCLNTMLKCIALGAVEFLSKPLSEDKLRNIWQHVVHKAFNAGASVVSESLKPVKESVVSMLQLQTNNEQHESRVSVDIEEVSRISGNDHGQSPGNDKYPAPSTPQLRQGSRLLDDGDCQEQTNCSADKESGENDGESKSVETTCGNLNAESTPQRTRLLDDGDCHEQTNCSTEKESGEHDGESKSAETTCGNLNAESTPQQRTRLLDDGDCHEQTNCSTEKESGEHDGESKSAETTCGNSNAESTPQPSARLLDDGDCHEQTNCSTEKEGGEHGGESKSVEITCGNLNAESTPQQRECDITLAREEVDLVDASKGESVASPHTLKRKVLSNTDKNTKSSNKVGVHSDSCETRANRKKMKVDWTSELHKKFVKAVEQLGIDQAIPSRILELMKVEGLTRHNVASHLQKYRMHKRHILPKEEERKWLKQRDGSYCVQRPIMAFPPYPSNHNPPLPPVYPIWGQSGTQTAGMQIWGSPGYPLWQPTSENWQWKPFPGVHAEAWGCPVLPVPPPQAPCFPYPQNMPALLNADAVDPKFIMPRSYFEHYPAEDVVDKVVKEAINKPWLPLPLGLKRPCTDSVLAELSRQGISSVPPGNNGSSNSG